MSSEKKFIRDVHKIEAVLETLSRSPHNRVLLRYNQFSSVLLGWFNDVSSSLTNLATSDEGLQDVFISLQNLVSVVYNFLPSLNTASWLTLNSAFNTESTNLLPILNSVFGEFSR